MMKTQITFIPRQQYLQLYRFGFTWIAPSFCIERNDSHFERKLIELMSACPFEYEEDMLLIEFEDEEIENSKPYRLEIENIMGLIPLSERSATFLRDRMNPNIRIYSPIENRVLEEAFSLISKNEIDNSRKCLWKILNLPFDQEEVVNNIGVENLLKGLELRKIGYKLNNIESSSQNFWTLLIAYDRYEFFPKHTIGYFYDVAEVFSFSKGKIDGLVGTKVHRALETIYQTHPTIQLHEIVNRLDQISDAENFIAENTQEGVKHFVSAVVYLRLKEEIVKCNGDLSKVSLFNQQFEHITKDFHKEVSYAVTLLSAFFGYKAFYDFFYEKMAIPLFEFKKYRNHADTQLGSEMKNSERQIELETLNIQHPEDQEEGKDNAEEEFKKFILAFISDKPQTFKAIQKQQLKSNRFKEFEGLLSEQWLSQIANVQKITKKGSAIKWQFVILSNTIEFPE